MKKITPMKRLSHVLENLKDVLSNNFDFNQKNKKAGSYIPFDVRKDFKLDHGATTAGIPFDTMYFFKDVKNPHVKAAGMYMPQPGKSIVLGFEYNDLDEPLITPSTVSVGDDHRKTVKSCLPLSVTDIRSRLKAFVDEMRYHKNSEIEAILVLFERIVIVNAVEESQEGLAEISKIEEALNPLKMKLELLEAEQVKIGDSLNAGKSLAKKEIMRYATESGIDERIRGMEKKLDLLKEERSAKFLEIERKHNLHSLVRQKEVVDNKVKKVNRKMKSAVESFVGAMPIAMRQAIQKHFENI